MRIAVIHGSPRKGNTYKAARLFMESMKKRGDAEFIEFHLPKDLPEFCLGCMTCFMKGEGLCPHAAYTMPLLNALTESDAMVFTTPVYALGPSGAMKSFLDHFAYMFIAHRPRPEMFGKKAFIISTTAGAGTGKAIGAVALSLRYWGVNRIFSFGFALREVDWAAMGASRRGKAERKLTLAARRFYDEVSSGKKHAPYLSIRMMFIFMRSLIKGYDSKESLDKQYWEEHNWFKTSPF